MEPCPDTVTHPPSCGWHLGSWSECRSQAQRSPERVAGRVSSGLGDSEADRPPRKDFRIVAFPKDVPFVSGSVSGLFIFNAHACV